MTIEIYCRRGHQYPKDSFSDVQIRRGAFVACVHNNSLLVTTPYWAPDQIELPGGALHDNEAPLSAALRESREEARTGLIHITPDRFLTQRFMLAVVSGRTYYDYREKFFLVTEGLASAHFDGVKFIEGEGTAQWIPLSSLNSKSIRFDHRPPLEEWGIITP